MLGLEWTLLQIPHLSHRGSVESWAAVSTWSFMRIRSRPRPPVPSVFPLEQYLYVYLCVFRVNTCAMPQAHSWCYWTCTSLACIWPRSQRLEFRPSHQLLFWVQLHDWEDFMKHFGDFSCCGNLNRGHEVSSDYHCEKAARVTVRKPHTALPTWVNSTWIPEIQSNNATEFTRLREIIHIENSVKILTLAEKDPHATPLMPGSQASALGGLTVQTWLSGFLVVRYRGNLHSWKRVLQLASSALQVFARVFVMFTVMAPMKYTTTHLQKTFKWMTLTWPWSSLLLRRDPSLIQLYLTWDSGRFGERKVVGSRSLSLRDPLRKNSLKGREDTIWSAAHSRGWGPCGFYCGDWQSRGLSIGRAATAKTCCE